ncbi:MAG: biotin--[acetyl-CoA-carboxylase] ligase [Nitrospirae bacterium]|nr:biotin--[acetyl-CoA-carboxylase] ligase [Nitrospirota bacterium]
MAGHNKSDYMGPVSPEAIVSGLESGFWGEVICYQTSGSTNDIALLHPFNDSGKGLVIVAEAQEKGRGRFGRRWASPAGVNICMSMRISPEIIEGHASFLTIMAALASASALREETGLDVLIKWPNDLMVSGKKLGGILAEVKSERGLVRKAVVGIGINLNTPACDFPGEIADTATSAYIETGCFFSRAGVISRVLNEFGSRLSSVGQSGSGPLIEEIKSLSSSLGRQVSVTVSGSNTTISGLAEDIDDQGMLLVRLASGELKRVSCGDLAEQEGGNRC